MTKTDKKIISIFLLLILLIVQLSPVFAADYEGQETKKTLTQYLIENGVDGDGDGVLSDAEWAKVKNLDLTNIDLIGIEKAVNLKNLYIDECYNMDEVDFSKFTKLENLSLSDVTLSDAVQDSIGGLSNLESLELSVRANYSKIDYTKLQKLRRLFINASEYDCSEFRLPKMAGLKELNFIANKDQSIDLTQLGDLESLIVSLEGGRVSCPKFTNLSYIQICGGKWNNPLASVEGALDLSRCEDVYGTLKIENVSELVLNERVLCGGSSGNWDIWSVEGEKTLVEGERFELGSSLDHLELVSNSDSSVAVINDEKYAYGESFFSKIVVAKNAGTTDMKIKDALGREITLKIKVCEKWAEKGVDTTLGKTGVTAKFLEYEERVLKSNGELWKVNS